MKKELSFAALFMFFSFLALSQKMDPGYVFLEEGAYSEAQSFFTDILKEHPTNKTARICQARAMGLASDQDLALSKLLTLEQDYPADYEVGLNVAEAYLWNKNYSSGKEKYLQLLQQDANNFVARLGFANALAGLNNNLEALGEVNKALVLKPGNASALVSKKFILIALAYTHAKKREHKKALSYLSSVDQIEMNQKNALEIRAMVADQKALKGSISYFHSSDNARNTASSIAISQSKAWNSKNILSLEAQLRTTANEQVSDVARQNSYLLKNKTLLSERLNLDYGIGLLHNNSSESDFKNLISFAEISMQLNDHNYLSLRHQSDYLQYNSTLIKSNLRADKFKLDYHLYSSYKIGFYNSSNLALLSDNNKSYINFSSLYYQILDKPLLKVGVNYSYIHFEEARPLLYFSPDQYQAGEAFVHFENLSSAHKWKYKILLAGGLQKVESELPQRIARAELQLGYQLHKKLSLNLNYLYSNSAQNNTLGTYEFQRIGLILRGKF